MENTYWHRQTDKPLFPDLLWSRPENKMHAGKLLIIGGNQHGFAAPAQGYELAIKAGIGTARVVLPDKLRRQIQKFQGVNLEMEYAPSTISGSLASKALAEILDASNWADGILLAGDLGRNSETAILLEKLVSKTKLPITLTKDAVDYFTSNPLPVISRGNTCLVLSLAQLQKLITTSKFTKPITFSMDLMHLVEVLHEFTEKHDIYIVTKHLDNILVAVNGQVCTTKTTADLEDHWRLPYASRAAVWWLQNQNKPFEALSSSVIG